MEPHSLVGGTGESGSVRLGPGLRPLKPTPHGPPTGSGGREKWFIGGRKKWKIERLLSAFSQRVPTHIPSPPSRWAGRYQRDNERAAGQVSCKKYSLSPTHPPEKGVPGEEPPPPGVLSPISSQEMGLRLGKPRFPAVPTAMETPHNRPQPKHTEKSFLHNRRCHSHD